MEARGAFCERTEPPADAGKVIDMRRAKA
jgi:hypothetical protein